MGGRRLWSGALRAPLSVEMSAKQSFRADDYAAERKFTTVEARYLLYVVGLKARLDDMKQECVQWHSLALMEAR